MKKMSDIEVHKKYYDAIHERVKSDPFAQSLGIELTKFEAGNVEAKLTVQDHMVNTFGTVHGAVIYALADHVFSVICNAYGKVTVGLSTTMHFMKAAKPGDTIIARGTEERRNNRTGFYRIEVYHENDLIATMEAVSYSVSSYFVPVEEEVSAAN